MNRRLKILGITFIFGFVLIILKLAYWQILKSSELTLQARNQQTSDHSTVAPRGNILASDGSYIAAGTNSFLVYAYLPDIKDNKNTVANTLAPLFARLDIEDIEKSKIVKELSVQWQEDTSGEETPPDEKQIKIDEEKRIEDLLNKNDTTWVALRRKIDANTKSAIEAFHMSGIGFDQENARYYPEDYMSAQLLGFVGKDDEGQDKGYFGLEGFYDLTLKGKRGFLERESNPLGIPILIGNSKSSEAQKGVDLLTHIDKYIELKVEDKLKKAIETYKAASGTVVIMDPKSGGILAMSAFPTYQPRTYYSFTNEVFKNPIISDSFEPGSVFKPIIMAAGLDAGVVEPDTKCDICGEPLKVDKYYIKTWNNEYEADRSMTDVIVHSDNVGMAFVGKRLGAKKFYDYLEKFGFGRLTEIDLQGEMSPPLRKERDWSYVDVATASFGQGIAVTPIQLITAVSTIARGGVSIAPQVVDKLKLDSWEKEIKPVEGKRVISQKAATEITDMMVAASESGEAQWTALHGFKIAGKTGTAQIPFEGHYDTEKTIASFVGFAPADSPKFVMLVTLREPQSSQWASETAAPLWYDIAKDLFAHFNIQPEN